MLIMLLCDRLPLEVLESSKWPWKHAHCSEQQKNSMYSILTGIVIFGDGICNV